MVSTPEPVAGACNGAAVQFTGVSKSFGSVAALDGATWEASAGQVTCILGPNGAGKSTAMDLATGLQQSDRGSVRVLQTDPWRSNAEHRARVGVMLQDGGLPQSARPRALVSHLARMYSDAWPTTALCGLLGIDEFATTPVRRISGGQRRRLALAAALVGRPQVIFLDEPTGGLDPHARRVTHQVIRTVADEGATVVLSTHAFEEAERLADMVVILAAGRVVASGSVPALCSGQTLEQRYFALTDRGPR